jgi:hypothetical protein
VSAPLAVGRRLVLAGVAALAARPAFAIDPGVAKGGYKGDEGSFQVSHAVALAMDGAEGFGDDDVKMRVVLSQAEVLPSALTGLAFPPVWAQARAGKVKGLLLAFDPADKTKVYVTVLAPSEPGYSLATTTLSSSQGVWSRLDVSATRISGELKPDLSEAMGFSFSAPVFTNPIVADLKGPAVQASEPVKVLIARAQALQKGDIATVKALSTDGASANFDKIDPEFMKAVRREIPGLIQQLKTAKRVVIRRETAAVQLDKESWVSADLVDGTWKGTD